MLQKKKKEKLCFLQQRTLFILTWYSFLRLKPMFSIFHNLYPLLNEIGQHSIVELEIKILNYATYSSFAPLLPLFSTFFPRG